MYENITEAKLRWYAAHFERNFKRKIADIVDVTQRTAAHARIVAIPTCQLANLPGTTWLSTGR